MKKRFPQTALAALLILCFSAYFPVKKVYAYPTLFGELLDKPVKLLKHIGIVKRKAAAETVYSDSDLYIYPPAITKVYENSNGETSLAKPEPITFYFNASASNIEIAGKEVGGISISPECEGVWKWESEYCLVFTPANDWPANETYKIKFPKEIFNGSLELKNYSYEVQTPAFAAELHEFALYQDPENPKTHRLQAVFKFSHCVDSALFEKNLKLTIDKKALNRSVSYDGVKRTAYVVSAPVEILTKDRTAAVELSSAKAASGGKAMEGKIGNTVNIPSQDKFFRIDGTKTVILKNDKEEPEQFLEISFTAGADASEMEGKTELYLLPRFHPDGDKNKTAEYEEEEEDGYYDGDDDYVERTSVRRPASYAWKFSEITPEILAKSKKLDIKLMESEDKAAKVFLYKYFAPDLAKRYVYVMIKEGIKSETDFTIKKPYSDLLVSAAFPKEVRLLNSGSLLPLDGSKRLTFVTRGVNGLKVNIARVLPNQINHLISQTYGSFGDFTFSNKYEFNESNISRIFSKIIPLEASVNKANYSSIDMGEFLKSAGSSGLFFIDVRGYDLPSNSADGPSDRRFILATDLGILVKKDKNSGYNVFVMSISKGQPVADAKVEILGKNGIPVLTRRTNGRGCAVFNKIEGYRNEKQPVAFVVTSGEDISFMPFERYDRAVDYSKFSVGGEYSSKDEKGIKAFIFSDRGVYRPGDEINLGVIVKNSDWSEISGIPVKTVLKDPYGKTVFEMATTLNGSGFFSVDGIKTENIYPTGAYTAGVYLVKDDKREFMIGSESLRVEEFRTDNLKIKAKIYGSSGQGWALPENLKALVAVNNFFAAPAQNRMIKAQYSLNPAGFAFPKFADYEFPDPHKANDRNAIRNVSESFPDAKSDENGEAFYDFNLSKFSGGTYNLVFSAEGFEGDSGKSVYAYDSIRVSPYKYLIGFKSDSKLAYLGKGSCAMLDLIAVDNGLKTTGLKNLKARMMRIQHISSLVKQNNGVYKYQTVTKETLVEENDVEISSKGSKLNLNTKEPGNYIMEIVDGSGMKVLSVPFFVAGDSNRSYAVEKDANLMVNLNNDDVEPGSRIILNITAPYAGAGLITVEKDKIYAYKWFKTDSNSTVQTITVPEDIEGNAYVNVSFIRSMDSKEIFSSPHSYAAVPFRVSLAKRMLKIDLNSKETARPGDELEISYRASKDSKILIYAVDEGILQVARYKNPDPLNFFFKKSALEIETFQTVDLILPDYKVIRQISAAGGGEGYEEAIEKNLNPFARKHQKPAVFWSKMLDCSARYATVKYKIPGHFNGALRIMAVAANADQCGFARRDTIVKSPVIISPAAPQAAVAGDAFEVSASVSNNMDGSGSAPLEVWLETDDKFEITGTNKQTLEIKEGGEKIVKFNIVAKDKLGAGTLIFKAKHKDETFKAETSISVRPAYVYRTSIKSGILKNGKIKAEDFARDMYDEFSRREISASYSPQILFRTLKQYFDKYPYGCSEQIISCAFPFLYGSVSGQKGFITPQQQQKLFSDTQAKIRLRQLSDGSFSLWPQTNEPDIYATIYALHFFTDAKELGYPVANEILSAGMNRLEYFASGLPESVEDARLKAYAAYVLTRNNFITTNYLLRIEDYLDANFKKWKEDIVSAYMASCYLMLKDHKKAQDLIKSYKPEAKEKFVFYSDYDSSSQRNANYLYLCSRHFPDNLNPDAQSIADGLVKILLEGKFNTASSASSLLALLSYSCGEKVKDAGIKIRLKNAKGEEKELPLDADPFPYASFDSSAKSFTVASGNDPGKIYYSIVQQGFDKTAGEFSQGIELSREYLDSGGNMIKTANIGDEVTVRIRVRAKSKDAVSLAVVDLLPACFEIINGSQSGSCASFDAREDRMILYVTAYKNITEMTYRVKAVTKGTFTVPGVFAAGLYDTEISALTKSGKITAQQPGTK